MNTLLNLGAMCCMVATLGYYLLHFRSNWSAHVPALVVLVSYTVITGTMVHAEFLGGTELLLRIFYAASCFFMAGMVSVFLISARLIRLTILCAATLSALLVFSDSIVAGVINNGERITRAPGPYYSAYLMIMLLGVSGQIIFSVKRWRQCDNPANCVKWRAFAVASVPTHIMVLVLVAMMSRDIPTTTAVDMLHIAIISFCAVLVYAASGATLPALTLRQDKLRAAQQLSMAHITAVESLMARTELPAAMSVAMLTTITNQATAPWIRKTSMCVRGAVVQCIDLRSLAFCRRTRKAAQAAFDTVKASGSLSPLYYDDSTSPPTPVFFR